MSNNILDNINNILPIPIGEKFYVIDKHTVEKMVVSEYRILAEGMFIYAEHFGTNGLGKKSYPVDVIGHTIFMNFKDIPDL